jgi:hypothetical protein
MNSVATEEAQVRLGFRHAFLDLATCAIYVPIDRSGRSAGFHCFEGLPDEVAERWWMLIAGFERKGLFYTRRSAARAATEWLVPA